MFKVYLFYWVFFRIILEMIKIIFLLRRYMIIYNDGIKEIIYI